MKINLLPRKEKKKKEHKVDFRKAAMKLDDLVKIEDNFDEYREKKKADKMNEFGYKSISECSSGSQRGSNTSSRFSSFDSEASRVNFW